MFKRNLYFYDNFDSEFKDKKYKISRFVDLDTLTIISGSNLEGVEDLDKGDLVECLLDVKGKKLVVTQLA